MDTIELKFLLQLLGFPDYKASLSKLKPTSKTSDRNKACRQLRDRGYIDCRTEIAKIQITSAGKALLKQDTANLPISDREINVLTKCREKIITPSDTRIKDKSDRQAVMQALADRGLVTTETKVVEVWLTEPGKEFLRKVVEVWLTEPGKEFLRDEYAPKGTRQTINLSLLNNYLQFMRQFIGGAKGDSQLTTSENSSAKPTELEVLQAIQDLDQQLSTDNYLPIFHLRQRLQSSLSREELDQVLYRLENDNKIKLTAIFNAQEYTNEQFNAGIPQKAGGPLFFVRLVTN
jgi:hypothetical protein